MPPFAANAARFSLLFSTLLFSFLFCAPECVCLLPEGDGARDNDDIMVVIFVVRKLLLLLNYILCRSARVSLSVRPLPHLSPLSVFIYLSIHASTYPSLCVCLSICPNSPPFLPCPFIYFSQCALSSLSAIICLSMYLPLSLLSSPFPSPFINLSTSLPDIHR